MGGSLAVTIRTKENGLIKMDRWTNPTPYTFIDPDFLNGGETFKEYRQTWIDMCKAYDNGFHEKDYPMAEIYCSKESSRDMIAPSEYGIVFIDMLNKYFFSMNYYTSFETLSPLKIRLLSSGECDFDRDWLGRIMPRIIGRRCRETKQERKLSFNNIDDLIHHAEKEMLFSDVYILDWSGWNFAETNDPYKMMELIQNNNPIILTEKEISIFKNYGIMSILSR